MQTPPNFSRASTWQTAVALTILAFAPYPAAAADSQMAKPSQSHIVGVIELFTSQGCSSCPPADALLKTYAARSGVLALSMPVDYWDYLGWKDTLGSAKNSERQRDYAKSRGDGQVYTPQAVVNGVVHVNGASRRDIDAALRESEAQIASNRVPVSFTQTPKSIVIDVSAANNSSTPKNATIWLAVMQKNVDVAIKRGENHGKTISYTNVVRDLTPVGTWTGQPLHIELPRSTEQPLLETVAVLVQQGKSGPIIAAATNELQ